MRDVRRRERLAGLKRVSRRDGLADKAVVRSNFEDSPSERALSTSPSSGLKSLMGKGPPCDIAKNKENHQQQLDRRCVGHLISTDSISIPLQFPTSWLVDPFNTLPGASDVPIITSRLVFYCESTTCPYLLSCFLVHGSVGDFPGFAKCTLTNKAHCLQVLNTD